MEVADSSSCGSGGAPRSQPPSSGSVEAAQSRQARPVVAQEPSSGTAKGRRLAMLLLLQVTEVVLDPVQVVGDKVGTLATGARCKHLAC